MLTAGLTWPQFPKGCCCLSSLEWPHICCGVQVPVHPSWVSAWWWGHLNFIPEPSDSVTPLVKIDQMPILPAPTPLSPGAVSPGQEGHASISISALSLPFPRQPLHLRAAVLCAAIAGSSSKSLAAYLLIRVAQLLEPVRVLPMIATSQSPGCVP